MIELQRAAFQENKKIFLGGTNYMMHDEFMKLAGYEVSYRDYVEIIEPMYMALDLSKEEFVKCINKKRFALRSEKAIINDMKKTAAAIKANCTHFIDSENIEKLDFLAEELKNRKRAISYRIETKEFLYNDMYHSCCYYPYKVIISIFNAYEEVIIA